MPKNDIIEEQRKARREFLELKKMQKGEIKAPPKPSDIDITPTTFKGKLTNFWYHYKWYAVSVFFAVLLIAFLIVQCATREKYDFQVVYFSYNALFDSELNGVEKYIEKFATDINDDGETNVSVINCSFEDSNNNKTFQQTIFMKLQSMISSNDDTIMYIVDEKAEKYLSGISEKGFFEKPPIELGEEFYEATKTDTIGLLPRGLKAGNRRIKDTLLDKNEKAEKIFIECEKILQELKK